MTTKNCKDTVHERLKIARESIGKTQKEFADMLGVTYRTYQPYEIGDSKPGYKACEALTRLGFDPTWLLTGEGHMRRQAPTQAASGNGFVQGHHVSADEIHIDIHGERGIIGEPISSSTGRDVKWFHDWIDEIIKGKSINDIMGIAVKFKRVLDDTEGVIK